MDLNALRVFVTVAESASFSAAAKKLDLPKWSVSRSVSALEATIGAPLLHRTTRQVTLSPAGVALHARVAPLLSSLDQAASIWPEELGKPAGDVRVSLPNFFQTTVIGDAITKFTARYPEVNVDIHFESSITGMDEPFESLVTSIGDPFDLALWVRAAKMKSSSLVARRGWPVFGQLFASPVYLASHGLPHSLDELENCLWVFRDNSSISLEGPDGAETFKPHGRIRSNDVFFVREAIRCGAGIGILPNYLVEKDVALGQLVRVLPQYRSHDAYVYIVRPSTREVPLRVKVLSDFLYEYMKTNPLTPSIK